MHLDAKIFDQVESASKIATNYDGFYTSVVGLFLFLYLSCTYRGVRQNKKLGFNWLMSNKLYILEWKGLMQIIFILYHYFGCNDDVIIFSIVRSFVASYLFLSGYGYTMQTLSAKNGENGLFFYFSLLQNHLKVVLFAITIVVRDVDSGDFVLCCDSPRFSYIDFGFCFVKCGFIFQSARAKDWFAFFMLSHFCCYSSAPTNIYRAGY